MFCKYAANIQEDTHPECDFWKVENQLYWNHTSAWVFCTFAAYLQKSCFDEHLWGTTSASFYSTCLPNFSLNVCVKFGCFLIYFWIDQCSLQKEQSFILQNLLCSYSESFHVNGILGWIVFLQGGAWLNRCQILLELLCSFFFRKIFLQQKLVLFRYLRHSKLESPSGKLFSKHFDFRA